MASQRVKNATLLRLWTPIGSRGHACGIEVKLQITIELS